MAALQGERASAAGAVTASELTRKDRFLVIAAALMALFLGALDTLVMGAAMPTIVADMGRLELYSWVFSVYLLSRAVALPIFGKLADLYSGKHLFGFAIAIGVGISGSLLNARFIGTLSESGSRWQSAAGHRRADPPEHRADFPTQYPVVDFGRRP